MRNRKIEKLIKQNGGAELPASFRANVLEKAKEIDIVRGECRPRPWRKRLIAMLASLLVLVVLASSVGVYQEVYAEYYFDINPSMSITVNRLGIVNGVSAYNEEAEVCLAGVKLVGQKYESAAIMILDSLDKNGYMTAEAELDIGSADGVASAEFEKLMSEVETYVSDNEIAIKVVSDRFTEEERAAAKDNDMSPSKYRIINDIIALDSSYTFDSLKYRDTEALKELRKSLKQASHSAA